MGGGGPAAARDDIVGRARVIDGDTIEVGAVRVRLEGIDAPEQSQTCARRERVAGDWRCGLAATQALRRLVENANIVCRQMGLDKYRRVLGVCYRDGRDINAEMVRQGLAWAFVKYSQSYVGVEAEARRRQAGIWQAATPPAWDYRARRWDVAESAAPQGCAIKGNISRSGRIYHMPWSAWYGRVKVDEGEGERWFCTEGEAQAAGFRPAYGG